MKFLFMDLSKIISGSIVYKIVFLTVLWFSLCGASRSSIKNISDFIFTDYDSSLRPVCTGVTQVNASVGLALRQVIELDEPNQIIKLNLWIRMKWNDCLLQWNPADFGGVTNIVVLYKKLWVPDLTLYDSIATELYGLENFRPNIYSDGTVYYNFPTVVEALCPVDVTNFPFDTQICELIFGSWSYHGFSLDISPRPSPADLSSLKANVEWEVPEFTATRHVLYYGCCPEPYPDVTFYLHLKRKPAYYITNIILPAIMITVLLVLGFILPVSSGEKVSLEITVMLAMSVFQLLVADKLPPSAEAKPWIATFFNFILGLSGASTVLQVIVINIYFRGKQKPPNWVMHYVIRPVCFVTFVTLPADNIQLSCLKKPKDICSVKEFKDPEDDENYNSEVWKSFSNAVDRLSLLMFSFALMVGCLVIFEKITG